MFFFEGNASYDASRLPFIRHGNYYLFVNDGSTSSDDAIQTMISSSVTTPTPTPTSSNSSFDAQVPSEDDDEVFQKFHLDRFCLPFVCIVCCSAAENMFSIHFHDYKHTIETFYETHLEFQKEALKAIPVLPSTTNKDFSKMDKRNCYFNHFLLCIQDKLEFQLFSVKNQKRLATIIENRTMQGEALVDNQRRIDLLLFSLHSSINSLPPSLEPSSSQSILASVSTTRGSVRHKHHD